MHRLLATALLGTACLVVSRSAAADPVGIGHTQHVAPAVPPARDQYADLLTGLAKEREALAAAYARATGVERQAILRRARAAVTRAIEQELIPAWFGTRWEFYGTTETPGEGAIACGYFVSTVLRDAGFRVERYRLAQQSAENIVRTLAGRGKVFRYRNEAAAEVVAAVRRAGDGLFAVGLDFHVGFLVVEGEEVRFCHSSYIPDQLAVLCEPAETSAAFASAYRVVGPVLDDAMMDAWLRGRRIGTVRPGAPRPRPSKTPRP